MKILAKDANGRTCPWCEPDGSEKELREVKEALCAKKQSYLFTEKKREILRKWRVVASCDKPTKNEPFDYQTCNRPMCGRHIGSTPQEGHHRCLEHV